MPYVEFEEENKMAAPAFSPTKKQSSIVGLIMRLGLAKSEQAANRILVVTSIIALILAVYIAFR